VASLFATQIRVWVQHTFDAPADARATLERTRILRKKVR
jgi:hypothetical protein